MRVKKDFLVVSFPTTAAAMACESLCAEKGLLPEEGDRIRDALDEAGVPVSGMDVVPLWVLVKE